MHSIGRDEMASTLRLYLRLGHLPRERLQNTQKRGQGYRDLSSGLFGVLGAEPISSLKPTR